MTITALSNQQQRYLMARGGSARTGECYVLAVAQFVAYLREQGLDDDIRNFTPENVEGFMTYMAEHGISSNSACTKLSALSSLGKYGTRQKDGRGRYLLAENPVTRVERPKRRRPPEKYVYLNELQKLLTVTCLANERLAFDVLCDTALRVTELVNAKVRDLTLEGDRVKLTVRVKGGDREEITLGVEVGNRLIESLKFREARPDDPLLVNAVGGAYTRTSFSEMVLRLAKRAGVTRIPVRPHVIRHSIATLASELGAEVAAVAGLLNHSDLNTVSTYTHTRKARVNEIRDKVRAALRPERTGIAQ